MWNNRWWIAPYFIMLLISVITAFFPLIVFLLISGAIVFTLGWVVEKWPNKKIKPSG